MATFLHSPQDPRPLRTITVFIGDPPAGAFPPETMRQFVEGENPFDVTSITTVTVPCAAASGYDRIRSRCAEVHVALNPADFPARQDAESVVTMEGVTAAMDIVVSTQYALKRLHARGATTA